MEANSLSVSGVISSIYKNYRKGFGKRMPWD
jgi:hypothetical protein